MSVRWFDAVAAAMIPLPRIELTIPAFGQATGLSRTLAELGPSVAGVAGLIRTLAELGPSVAGVAGVSRAFAELGPSVAGVAGLSRTLAELGPSVAGVAGVNLAFAALVDREFDTSTTTKSPAVDPPAEPMEAESLGLIWQETLRELLVTLSRPAVRWTTIVAGFYLATALYVSMKVYRPEVTAFLEQPYWAFVTLLLGVLATADKRK
jgi:hypothetical protein